MLAYSTCSCNLILLADETIGALSDLLLANTISCLVESEKAQDAQSGQTATWPAVPGTTSLVSFLTVLTLEVSLSARADFSSDDCTVEGIHKLVRAGPKMWLTRVNFCTVSGS